MKNNRRNDCCNDKYIIIINIIACQVDLIERQCREVRIGSSAFAPILGLLYKH